MYAFRFFHRIRLGDYCHEVTSLDVSAMFFAANAAVWVPSLRGVEPERRAKSDFNKNNDGSYLTTYGPITLLDAGLAK